MVGTTERIALLSSVTLGEGEERLAGPTAIRPGEAACLFVDFDGPLERWVERSPYGRQWDRLERAVAYAGRGDLVTVAILVPAGAGGWVRCTVRAIGPGATRVSVTAHAGRQAQPCTRSGEPA